MPLVIAGVLIVGLVWLGGVLIYLLVSGVIVLAWQVFGKGPRPGYERCEVFDREFDQLDQELPGEARWVVDEGRVMKEINPRVRIR